jgi:hypothetical protein
VIGMNQRRVKHKSLQSTKLDNKCSIRAMIPFICIEIFVLKEKFEDTKVVHGRMTDNSMTERK